MSKLYTIDFLQLFFFRKKVGPWQKFWS